MKERKRPGPAAVLSQPFDETIFYLASREDTYFPPMAGWSLSVLSNNARQSSSVIRFQPALCFLSLCSPSTVLSCEISLLVIHSSAARLRTLTCINISLYRLQDLATYGHSSLVHSYTRCLSSLTILTHTSPLVKGNKSRQINNNKPPAATRSSFSICCRPGR